MQPANGPRKRIASALVLVVGVTAVAATASGAFGRAGPARSQPSSTGSVQRPCTPTNCVWNRTTPDSSINVVPTSGTPSFNARTSNPGHGMIHGDRMTGVLDCGSYQPTDPGAFQFFLGAAFRGDVTYKVTYTVNNVKNVGNLQFCLGATFSFKTQSGQAKSVTLPNGLTGFAGLVQRCGPTPTPPCLVSKTKVGKDAVLRVLIPAVKGADPWGRS